MDNSSQLKKERLYLGILGLVGLLRFVNLGFLDLQAWDEALYAVRSEGILHFGGWIDQTPFAIDGLYSALHPPLYVWLTSIAFSFLGVTEFAARFFSSFFAALTLPVMFWIGKKLSSVNVGFLAALMFGLNPFVTFFSRQGQFDATLVFFLSLSILLLIDEGNAPWLKSAVQSGLAVGGALLTKLFVGLGIPLAYGIWIAVSKEPNKSRHWKALGVLTVLAALVALPWHAYMTAAHGNGNPFFFLGASALFERTLSGIEGNVKPLEIFYFVNQMIVLFPVGVVWFCLGLYETAKTRNGTWMLMALWFIVFFVVFSLIRTKLAVYLMPLLVPASLISAQKIQDVVEGKYSARATVLLIGGTLLTVLWASSQAWRNSMKAALLSLVRFSLPTMPEIMFILPFLILGIIVLIAAYLAFKKSWIEYLRKPLPYFLFIPSFVFCSYQILILDATQYKDGAAELVELIQEMQPSQIVVAGYERNPQLTYYLEGADIGWRDDLPIRRIIPPKERVLFQAWLAKEVEQEPDDALIIIEKDKFIRYEWVTPAELKPVDYELVFESRRYAAFHRIKTTQYANLSSTR